MIITLNLAPDIEQGILAQAQAKGLSITDYVEELVEQQARQAAPYPPAPASQAKLFELFAPVRGLLTDEEIDTYFSRNRLPSRPVDLG